MEAVTPYSTHKIDQQMVKALTYDIPEIKLKIRQFQVMGRDTRQLSGHSNIRSLDDYSAACDGQVVLSIITQRVQGVQLQK